MALRFQIACYIAEMPKHHDLRDMLIGLRKLVPGAIDRYEFRNWAGKERRGKYDEDSLFQKLQIVPAKDLSFVSIHTRMQEEDANVPKSMIAIARRFLEDNPVTGIYINLPAADVTDFVEFCRHSFELISSYSDARYGFGTAAPYHNADFDYGPAIAMHVDKKTEGYRIVEDLDDRLIEAPSTLDPVIKGCMVRSVYRVNFITDQLAEKMSHILKADQGIGKHTLLKMPNKKQLWTVFETTDREKIFRMLYAKGMILESDWFNLATYQPRFATIDDIVI